MTKNVMYGADLFILNNIRVELKQLNPLELERVLFPAKMSR